MDYITDSTRASPYQVEDEPPAYYSSAIEIAVIIHVTCYFLGIICTVLRDYTLYYLVPFLVLAQHDQGLESSSDVEEEEKGTKGTSTTSSALSNDDKATVHSRQRHANNEASSAEVVPSAPVSPSETREPIITTIHGLAKHLYAKRGILGIIHGVQADQVSFLVSDMLKWLPVKFIPMNGNVHAMMLEVLDWSLSAGKYHYTLATKGLLITWLLPRRGTIPAVWRVYLLRLLANSVIRPVQVILMASFGIMDRSEAVVFIEWKYGQWPRIPAGMPVQAALGHALLLLLQFVFVYGTTTVIKALIWRIHVSMLPENYDTIIPVQRDFGISAAKERGYLTISEAWTSLTWRSWGRLGKAYAQVLVVDGAIFAARAIFWILVAKALGLEALDKGARLLEEKDSRRYNKSQ